DPERPAGGKGHARRLWIGSCRRGGEPEPGRARVARTHDVGRRGDAQRNAASFHARPEHPYGQALSFDANASRNSFTPAFPLMRTQSGPFSAAMSISKWMNGQQ